MKRGTPRLYKTLRLAQTLGCSRPEAGGLLEFLWHLTAEQRPQGDIGKLTNGEIAAGIYTDRDPDTLIAAFVQAGWLDESPEHRLLVHDWPDHADNAVKKLLFRRKLPFLTCTGPVAVHGEKSSRHVQTQRRATSRLARGSGSGSGKGSGSESSSVPEEAETDVRAREGFDAFWAVYPRKAGKRKAREAWQKLAPTADEQRAITTALAWQRRTTAWLKEGGQYIPHPATYLHQRRWEDEPPQGPDVPERTARNAVAMDEWLRRSEA